MAFESRREILFAYTVKDANPNGDPLNADHPRYDEETEEVLVSDVRIKRTIRDEWVRRGKMVFIDGESKTLNHRFSELKDETGEKDGQTVMSQCLDSRLFGVTFALGNESFCWPGPVQFKWGRSLHAVTVDFVQGTSAFATDRQGAEKQQRSFRNEYKVPFAFISVYGIVNQFASSRTGAEENDLDELRTAIWEGTQNLITRSKNEHMPRFYLEIVYKPGFTGKIGSFDEKVRLASDGGKILSKDDGRALRSVHNCYLDISSLVDSINNYKNQVEKVMIRKDSDTLVKGLDTLDNLGISIDKAWE